MQANELKNVFGSCATITSQNTSKINYYPWLLFISAIFPLSWLALLENSCIELKWFLYRHLSSENSIIQHSDIRAAMNFYSSMHKTGKKYTWYFVIGRHASFVLTALFSVNRERWIALNRHFNHKITMRPTVTAGVDRINLHIQTFPFFILWCPLTLHPPSV